MDYSSGRKRRGFFKTKLMPLYRAPALSSSSSKQPSNNNNNYNSNSVHYSSKVIPFSQSSAPSTVASFVVHHPKDHNNNIAADSTAVLLNKQQGNTISFGVPAETNINYTRATEGMKPRRHQVDHNNNFFGVVGDCRIDTKASTYISTVQERFKHHEHTY